MSNIERGTTKVNYGTEEIKEIGGENKLEKAHEYFNQMILIEEKLVKGEISLERFLIYLGAFERELVRLNTCHSKYWPHYEETIGIFNKNGLYHPYNKKILIEFKKRDSDEALNEEIRKFVRNKSHYKDVRIRGKEVWGIDNAAIVLVNEVTYDEKCARQRGYRGRKEFHNYFYKTGKPSSYDDGIEIMRELKEEYGRG